ncbi:S8 family serine peptidase [Nocardioides sp. Bht2]|uniref:S8 family serine peptidase n=1 Tax=Nocardioides sp. Bht2 TaxID=3392297 RepID=UPI0039B52C6A
MRRQLRDAALAGASMLAALTAFNAVPSTATATPSARAIAGEELYLVAMASPGTAGYRGSLNEGDYRAQVEQEQDALLTALGASAPESRWTTALSGMSVRLNATQARAAGARSDVALVEANELHTVAAAAPELGGATPGTAPGTGRGGRGTVIGLIDTGIDASSPAFVSNARLGPEPARFRGTCTQVWTAATCDDKIAGARYFVQAFGAENLRAGAAVSARDDQGHGTMVASLAAGNLTTATGAGRRSNTRFSGVAPDARVASYKACWQAPDPDQDGCASADIVSAIDAAVSDRVDVLALAITSSPARDVVDLALLGAAESDIVVIGAAGNNSATAGYAEPWVTTVGASTRGYPRGELRLADGTRIAGLLTTRGVKERRRVVAAAEIAGVGVSRRQARLCAPGSLDAGKANGRIVVCERGTVARLTKANTVRLAGGAAMVLINARGDELAADLPNLPTLSISAGQGRALRARLATGRPHATIATLPASTSNRVAQWSAPGATGSANVKPDLVAPGLGVLAATSSASRRGRWDVISGTSAATAAVAGAAARVRSRHSDWSQAAVRSALVGTADPIRNSAITRQGAGLLNVERAVAPGLVHDVAAPRYRAGLDEADAINQSSVAVASRRGVRSYTRTLTNVRSSARYWSVRTTGFTGHQVQVRPVAVKLGAGSQARYTITVRRLPGRAPATDDGWIVWRDAHDNRVRVPVVITR